MSALASLKLTAAKKPTNIPPSMQRRMKIGKRLGEQIELAKAQQAGGTFTSKRLKNIKDAEGNKRAVEVAKRVKQMWFTAENGKLCIAVRYGAKLIELAKGKSAVELGSTADLVPTLELIKSAIDAGELDAQLEAASGSLRSGFKR